MPGCGIWPHSVPLSRPVIPRPGKGRKARFTTSPTLRPVSTFEEDRTFEDSRTWLATYGSGWRDHTPNTLPRFFKGFAYKASNYELRGGSFLDDLLEIEPFGDSLSLEDREGTRHADLGFRIAGMVSSRVLPQHLRQELMGMEEATGDFLPLVRDW